MEITDLIDIIKETLFLPITRGVIIDYVAENTDTWILVLKALLIKNSSRFIAKSYLLEKLEFMKRNPKDPQGFLDIQGTLILNALRDY